MNCYELKCDDEKLKAIVSQKTGSDMSRWEPMGKEMPKRSENRKG